MSSEYILWLLFCFGVCCFFFFSLGAVLELEIPRHGIILKSYSSGEKVLRMKIKRRKSSTEKILGEARKMKHDVILLGKGRKTWEIQSVSFYESVRKIYFLEEEKVQRKKNFKRNQRKQVAIYASHQSYIKLEAMAGYLIYFGIHLLQCNNRKCVLLFYVV